ncbi:MAG TPA: DUF58 domain-containing protein [Gaiellaceae bacterium]|nr:DUF58 domain-containing protein [Gaiellaceae bacterium]
MTARGRAVFALGVFCWIVAIVFGSPALYPVAAGLVLVVPLAVAWVRITLRQPHVSRRWRQENAVWRNDDLLEREDIRIQLELEREPGVPLPNIVAHERIGRLGEEEVELRPHKRGCHWGSYRLRNVPRGRHRFEPVRLSITDPFGLAESGVTLDEQQALVVYPHLVELERLFFEGGAGPEHGRRLLLRRPVGFDLHSVRDYQQGESLRRVHWPSTARRGALMVKELEDSPRDEVAVLLDGDPAGVTGSPPDSSFDVAVRAAGSILRAQVRSGRRCVLLLNNSEREAQVVSSDGAEWQRALELLAAAEPDARRPAAALLESADAPASCSLELVVVTSRVERSLVDRLLQRSLTRRAAALVYVEPESFVGRRRNPDPELLRLQSGGVPIAVVRQGDDLASALNGTSVAEVARA